MTEQAGNSDPKPAADASGGRLLSLSELLPLERIALDVQVDTWQEAIRAAGRLLFETDAVMYEYIEAMVKVAEELGPYIVIGPGIALPHARSEAGARQTALSLVKLAQPVNFGNPDNDPVRMVFALAAIDSSAHVVALQALAELFLSKDLMKQLFDAGTRESVLATFHLAERRVGT